MFSDCSGPCETCQAHFARACLAGHGDDDYSYASPEWIAQYKASLEEQKRNGGKLFNAALQETVEAWDEEAKQRNMKTNDASKERLSVWEAYQGGLAAVVIAESHREAQKLLIEYYGTGWSKASVSRITTCTYPMRPRVVMIGGKA